MMERISRLLEGERHILACILVLMMTNLMAFVIFERGYDATWTVVTLQTCLMIWVFGLCMRIAFPDVKGLYVFESFALTTTVGIQAALATATLAPMGPHYADETLARLDSLMVPFVSWPDAVGWLVERPDLFRAANYVYTSVNWQGPLLLIILALTGKARLMRVLTLCGGISSLIGLAVFAIMPARGAYIHHGFTREDLPDLMVGLPFEFPIMLEHLRNGTMDMLSDQSISGLISFPSFHAAGATMLALGWVRLPWIGPPMILLNAGVALSAIPIGSHYFSDIAAGILLGLVSFSCADRLLGTRHAAPNHESTGTILEPALNQN